MKSLICPDQGYFLKFRRTSQKLRDFRGRQPGNAARQFFRTQNVKDSFLKGE
jgi:hypothetical protein